jgi:hypothetical protein
MSMVIGRHQGGVSRRAVRNARADETSSPRVSPNTTPLAAVIIPLRYLPHFTGAGAS